MLSGAVLTVVVSVLVVRHVSYATLFSNMEPERASQVVEKLRDMKVRYRLAGGGRTILVPESDVYALRLDLATTVPPGGGGGYELFDKSKFGLTNFMQQITNRRALEGELARTIGSIDEVVAARVHLVVPERAVFAAEARQPSASVVLRLAPGARLGRKQIQGITALVAGAVEGLQADRVAIVDAVGTLLSTAGSGFGGDPETAARLEAETETARALEARAQSLLDNVVGPEQAVVRVAVELDFENVERESESYDPERSAIRSEQTTEQSNPEGGGESGSSLTNYEVNKTVERTKKAPGTIKRLTVAVTVDGRYTDPPEGSPKNTPPDFVTRPAAELEKLAALVRNAVGVDDRRGDSFHIACLQFDRSHDGETAGALQRGERRELVQAVISKGSIVIAAVIVLIALRLAFTSMAKVLGAPVAAPLPAGGAAGPDAGAAALSAFDLEMPAVTPPRNSVVTGRVSAMSRQKPEEAAALILDMLEQER